MKVIIIPLYGIGDVLMSTPAIRNIKEKLSAHITYLHMFTTTRDVLTGNPYVDENIYFPFLSSGKIKGLRFLLRFRKKYDVSINFYPANRKDYNLTAFIIGAPLRIGHRYLFWDIRELNFLKNRTVMEDGNLHTVTENLRLLDFLGIKERVAYPLEIYLNDEEIEFADKWLKAKGLNGKPIIGFHPGSSVFKCHENKRWPSDKFSQLIKELSKVLPEFAFLLFGGREENALKERIRSASGLPAKVFIVEGDSIRETASIMKQCRVFVTNDSGLLHVGAALQIPTVAIFGPSKQEWILPWKCEHRIVSLNYPCSPCTRRWPAPISCTENKEFACIREIKVLDVLSATCSLVPKGGHCPP